VPFTPDSNLAAQWEDLTLYQNKDADLTITLTDPVTGLAYNLTGLTVTLVRKANRDAADTTGTTYTCTVSSPASGVATVRIPATDNVIVGVSWYRVDLTGSETKAVKFGRLTVFAV
jgi:hypothetical protein